MIKEDQEEYDSNVISIMLGMAIRKDVLTGVVRTFAEEIRKGEKDFMKAAKVAQRKWDL